MTIDFPYPLVTTDWLGAALSATDVRVIDASWRMPGAAPAFDDHKKRRIPGAVFFDLDAIADHSTGLPHMLPHQDVFAAAAGRLGVTETDRVVIYDDIGVFSAARVWWTFRVMGHDRVSVLDGGLPKWLREGRPMIADGANVDEARYQPRPSRRPVRDHDAVRAALQSKRTVILDARPAARFTGDAPEPRVGLRRGHMPGARSLPHSLLLTDEGTMKSADELRALFAARAVTHDTPVIATCGSGVTAAVIALALEVLGHAEAGLYDGSWTEWGREMNDPSRFPVTSGGDE